jgi:GTPase SAR1 family protein
MLWIDIHSIIRVKVHEYNKTLYNILEKYYATFFHEKGNESERFDIILSQLRNKDEYAMHYQSKYFVSFWIKKIDGEVCIVFGYRGMPDTVIVLSNPIRLLYTIRKGFAGILFDRIVDAIHFALIRKRGVLFHGAVMSKGNMCILIVGPSGMGKSILVIDMLKDKWDYISEDKFILLNHKAYLFRPYIPIKDYHIRFFPELLERDLLSKNRRSYFFSRKWLKSFIFKYFPEDIISRVEGLYSPTHFAQVNEIFPDCKVIYSAKPNISVILKPGFETKFSLQDRETALQDILTLQWLAFPDFEMVIRTLSLFGYENQNEINNSIIDNLKDIQIFNMMASYNEDPRMLYRSLQKGLESIT